VGGGPAPKISYANPGVPVKTRPGNLGHFFSQPNKVVSPVSGLNFDFEAPGHGQFEKLPTPLASL